MARKEYSKLSTEPLTEFDEFLRRVLKRLEERKETPRSALVAVITEDGSIGTFYHNAQLSDSILMRGFIDLDIQTGYPAANGPFSGPEMPGAEESPEEGGERPC